MRLVTAISLLAISIVPVRAQQEEPGEFMGVGVTSCAEFAIQYRKDPEIANIIYFAWVQGLMSGLNLTQAWKNKRTHDLGALPILVQQLHIRTFCDQRPLLRVVDAAFDLFDTLPEIQPERLPKERR